MKRFVASICLVTLLCGAAFSFHQSAGPVAKFETADIHASPPRSLGMMVGGTLRDGRYELQNATMVDLIKTAYGVDDDRVLGGPSWLELDRFDVVAKAPPSTAPDVVRSMLQTLLGDRFNLSVHNDKKPVPMYVLSKGKGRPKLKESDAGGPSGCRPAPPATSPGPSYTSYVCRNLTLPEVAEALHQLAPGYVGSHPVVDATKIEGTWDFDIKWTGRSSLAVAGADGISLFDAVDKQLGLALEIQDVSMPVVVVENVNRKPAEWADGGGIAALPPPEFEVADIKPSAPGSMGTFIRSSPGGRWDASGTLRDIIGFAFDIPASLRTDVIVGGPEWLESKSFDFIAKAPSANASAGGGPSVPRVDSDTLRLMIRALLVDRFKLRTHTENRLATVYTIVALKGESKLRKAAESERAGCKPAAGAISANRGPVPAVSYHCQNTTMAELAKYVELWAGLELDHPVVDTTGLQDGWDFVLSFSPRALLQAPARPADLSGAAARAGQPGGLTVYEAFEQELGLRLTIQKKAIPVIVIDHVDQKPSNQ